MTRENFYKKVNPVGSQSARLYGMQSKNVPVYSILSMPGSQYANLWTAFADILKKVMETNIRTDRNDVLKTLQTSKLEDDEVIVSLD